MHFPNHIVSAWADHEGAHSELCFGLCSAARQDAQRLQPLLLREQAHALRNACRLSLSLCQSQNKHPVKQLQGNACRRLHVY